MIRRRDTCRLCGSRALEPVLSLPATPPANAFVRDAAPQEAFPLDVVRCATCGHAQLRHVVDPAVLFGDYVYASGTSPVFVRHFEGYAAEVAAAQAVKSGDLAVDIGSNDGVLLRAFKARGMRVLGVDPARKIAESATASGVETWPEFFSAETAGRIAAREGKARVITANNCMAHIDDLGGVVDAAAGLLAPDGVFVMEVQYLADLVKLGLWDMIYHEHVSYHAVGPLIPFFAAHGLGVSRVERVPTHGGSIRVWARRQGPFEARADWDAREAADTSPAAFAALDGRIRAAAGRLKAVLGQVPGAGEVAGYGVAAKATTLLYALGLTGRDVAFAVDDSPWKIGLLSPGLHLPVLAPAALVERRPKAVLIFAWNFADAIAARVGELFRAAGVTPPACIVPLPEPRLVTA